MNFGLSVVARETISRRGERALERFMEAANRLVLIAPTSIAVEVSDAARLLGQKNEIDGTKWAAEWQEVRTRLLVAARRAGGLE